MTTRRVPDHVIAEASRKLVERARERFGTKRTGLVCPTCRQPVAEIDAVNPVLFKCPACGHEWTARAS